MTYLLVSGYLTTINGPAEQHFIVPLDSEGKGIEEAARLDAKSLAFRKGLNTYTAPLSAGPLPSASDYVKAASPFFDREVTLVRCLQRAAETEFAEFYRGTSSRAQASVPHLQLEKLPFHVASRWCGNFYHDEYGGPDGNIPRGSFWMRVQRLDDKYITAAGIGEKLDFVSFCGTSTSPLAVGKPLMLLVAFTKKTAAGETHSNNVGGADDDVDDISSTCAFDGRQPVTHPGQFDNRNNTLVLVEWTREVGQQRMTMTEYRGKWAKTPQNEKFCGSFITRSATAGEFGVAHMQVIDSGSFFLLADRIDPSE